MGIITKPGSGSSTTSTSTVSARPAPPQVVCGVGFQWNGVNALGANYDLWEVRKPKTVGPRPVSQIQFAYPGWYEQDNGAGEAPSPYPATISAAVEIPADAATGIAAFTQKAFFKNGASAVALGVGYPLMLTEPMTVDLPANATFYEQTRMLMGAVNQSYVFGGVPRSGDVGYYSASGSTTSNIGTTGGFTAPATNYPFQLGGSIAVIGRPDKTHVAIAHLGDSITQGTGDNVGTGTGAIGYQMRATIKADGTYIPAVNLAKGSAGVSNEENQCLLKRSLLPYVTHVNYARVRNDIAFGRTYSQCVAYLTRTFQAIKRVIGPNGMPLYLLVNLVGPSCGGGTGNTVANIWRIATSAQKYYPGQGTTISSYAGVSIAAAGSGYPASTSFTVSAPAINLAPGQAAATFTVTTNSSGVPTSVSLLTTGGYVPDPQYNYFMGVSSFSLYYPVPPAGVIPTTYAGSGSGLTLNVQLAGFTNPADMTVTTGWEVGGVRDQVNAWIKSQVGILIDDYWDPNPFWEDPNNHGKYVTTGVTLETTPEGVHPAGLLHKYAATGDNTQNGLVPGGGYIQNTGTAATSLQAKYLAFTV